MGKIWLTLRYLLSFVFLWAFFDTLFGLGFSTESSGAWVGSVAIDFVFMGGLLFIGLSLFTGILFRLGTISGVLFYGILYLAGFIPPEHNPIVDDHIINLVLMVGLYMAMPVGKYGLSKWWHELSFVKRHPGLQ
jgi:thiosulfate dehydrogenase [quinone] large subunit